VTYALIVLGVVAWLACGVLSAGWAYAYFQREFPSIADERRQGDTRFALGMALLGPFDLIGLLLFLWGNGGFKYGWLWPGAKP
jgi:DNA-binding transcriptional regulator of glucitol operon